MALLSPFQFDDDVRRPPRRLQKLQHSSKRRKGDLTLDQLQKKLEAAEKRKKDYEQRILDKISVDVRCYPLVVCLDSSFFLFFSVIFLCQCTLSLTRTQFPSGLQTRRPADRREQQTEEQAKQVEQKVDQKVDKAMVRSSSLPAPCSNPCCFPHPWLVLAFLLLRFLSLLVNHLHVTGAHTCPPSPPPPLLSVTIIVAFVMSVQKNREAHLRSLREKLRARDEHRNKVQEKKQQLKAEGETEA